MRERRKRKGIGDSTAKGHCSAYNKLRQFWQMEAQINKIKKDPEHLPFAELTPKLLENFRSWMKTHQGNAPSTVEKEMTRLRTYIKRALAANYAFNNPLKVVKIKHPETYPNILEQEQLLQLLDLYRQPDISDNRRMVLRHFLFSCFTGLRVLDIKQVEHANIQGDWLIITPKKICVYAKSFGFPYMKKLSHLSKIRLASSLTLILNSMLLSAKL